MEQRRDGMNADAEASPEDEREFKRMKIVLLSNYAPDRAHSMLKYAEMMQRGLTARGHAVAVVHPPVIFGRLPFLRGGAAKWIGYIDKYLMAPPWMRWKCRGADSASVDGERTGAEERQANARVWRRKYGSGTHRPRLQERCRLRLKEFVAGRIVRTIRSWSAPKSEKCEGGNFNVELVAKGGQMFRKLQNRRRRRVAGYLCENWDCKQVVL
jgi:hypothetical protein